MLRIFQSILWKAIHAKAAKINKISYLYCLLLNFLCYVNIIPGLDPAQPCFGNASGVERLDSLDADFVDVIHTNGRLLQKIGFGLPDPIGNNFHYLKKQI